MITDPGRRLRRNIWLSRLSLAGAAIATCFVAPLSDSYVYYIVVSAAYIIPIINGPWLYRVLAIVGISCALYMAWGQYVHGWQMQDRIRQIHEEESRL